MASSCTFQKGLCQQNTQNAELTSKLVSLGSSMSQMIYSLLAVYTGYLVLRSLSSQSHLKLSTVHHFRTPPSLQLSMQFIVAKCSQAELPYQFRVLEKGTFLPKSSYGSIQVSQFSFFGISIPKRSQSLQRYCCTHHYIQKDVNQWDVDFIITTGLQASLTVSELFLFIAVQ